VLVGFDWGGGIALRMAAKFPNKFSHVIVQHASLGGGKEQQDEVAKIKCPVLVEWVSQDMFHPWSKFKPLVKSIKNCTTEIIRVQPWKDEFSWSTYAKYSNQICLPIIKFLTGEDPTKTKKAAKGKEVEGKTTSGKSVKQIDNIVFKDEITAEEEKEMLREPSRMQQALDYIKSVPSD